MNFDDQCYAIDILDMPILSSILEILCKDLLELSLIAKDVDGMENFELEGIISHLETCDVIIGKRGFDEIDTTKETTLKPSIEDPLVLELK